MNKVILFLCILLFSSCSNSLKNTSSINDYKQLRENSLFTLDTIETKEWDSVYIITPYAHGNFENQLDSITYLDRTRIEDASLNEGECALVFIKQQNVVNYIIIPRNIADFAFIGDTVCFPAKQKYRLDDKRVVHVN